MLTRLSINDLVVFDKVDVELGKGLTVLWGDTGVGKSRFLDGLSLAIGGRSDPRLIRQPAELAKVEATFKIDPNQATGRQISAILAQNDIECGGVVEIYRELGTQRSSARIAGKPVSLKLLAQIGELLIEVQGQFASLRLTSPDAHLEGLDAYAGLGDDLAAYARVFRQWRSSQLELKNLNEVFEKAQAAKDLLQMEIERLEALDVLEIDWNQLEETYKRGKELSKVHQVVSDLVQELQGGEDAFGKIVTARRIFTQNRDLLGKEADELGRNLDATASALEEAVALLDQLNSSLGDMTPQQIAKDEDRYFTIKEAAKRFKVEPEALNTLLDEKKAELTGLDNIDAKIDEQRQRETELRNKVKDLSQALHQRRVQSAASMTATVLTELAPLHLERARFEVSVTEQDFDKVKENGTDDVVFLFSANPGMALKPLHQQASGGELSRLMLALQLVLQGKSQVHTLAFDEVEAGLGGQTAHAVGERLLKLARFQQVLVVTHSPQVAAHGDSHLLFSKVQTDDSTVTEVRSMNKKELVEQLARSLSGAKAGSAEAGVDGMTFEARTQAERLIRKAHNKDSEALLLEDTVERQ